jgi:hypothetical protein
MKEFALRKIEDGHYYLFCFSFESILNYLHDLENAEEIKTNEGVLTIDQLLVTGNGENRFIACDFSNGAIDFSTARNIAPNAELDALSLNIMRENFNLLDSSILTEKQRDLIYDGNSISQFSNMDNSLEFSRSR